MIGPVIGGLMNLILDMCILRMFMLMVLLDTGMNLHPISNNYGRVLKTLFRRIYVTIPSENFTLFLREIEFRYLITNKNDNEKLKELLEVFDYINSTVNFNLYDLDSLNLI